VDVIIRGYDPRDAAGLADVFFRSVRQVALSDYTAAQVRAWAPEPRTAEWAHAEASDGRLVLVAADEDDRPVAYIDLEPDGHINRLFCAPEAAGQEADPFRRGRRRTRSGTRWCRERGSG